MLLPGVNVLICAHVEDSVPEHPKYAAWIAHLAVGAEPFALSVLVRSGFVRVVTNPRVIESFNGELRDELLDREVFYTLLEVRVLMERYRRTYNVSDRTDLWATGRRRLRPSYLPTLLPCLSD